MKTIASALGSTTPSFDPTKHILEAGGWTPISNDLLLELAKLADVKTGIQLLVRRFTVGFHRLSWVTTRSRMAEYLGCTRQAISQALNQLIRGCRLRVEDEARKIRIWIDVEPLKPTLEAPPEQPVQEPDPVSAEQELDRNFCCAPTVTFVAQEPPIQPVAVEAPEIPKETKKKKKRSYRPPPGALPAFVDVVEPEPPVVVEPQAQVTRQPAAKLKESAREPLLLSESQKEERSKEEDVVSLPGYPERERLPAELVMSIERFNALWTNVSTTEIPAPGIGQYLVQAFDWREVEYILQETLKANRSPVGYLHKVVWGVHERTNNAPPPLCLEPEETVEVAAPQPPPAATEEGTRQASALLKKLSHHRLLLQAHIAIALMTHQEQRFVFEDLVEAFTQICAEDSCSDDEYEALRKAVFFELVKERRKRLDIAQGASVKAAFELNQRQTHHLGWADQRVCELSDEVLAGLVERLDV